MTDFLVKRFIKNSTDVNDPAVRTAYGNLAGAVGIFCNVLLCAAKLAVGTLFGSISITADAVNNLSDASSSVITLVGFRLSAKPADDEHPYGHARIEYLAGLAVSVMILVIGVELARSSIGKILSPTAVEFSLVTVAVLLLSIGVKLWMAAFNKDLSRRIGSTAMAATATDSLSDAAATAVVLICTFIDHYLHVNIDGVAGLVVAVFILRAGWGAAKDTLDPLLGRPMDPELARDIDKLVVSHPNILGIHDLVYHDYGPGRAMMSFHAEVPADADLLEMHDIIDHIERELKEKHHIETVIHMDPVVNDERTAALRAQVEQLAHEIDPVLSIHDLRITAGPRHTNVLFDVMVPYGFRLTDSQVRGELSRGVKKLSEKYTAVIEVDHSYVEQRENP